MEGGVWLVAKRKHARGARGETEGAVGFFLFF